MGDRWRSRLSDPIRWNNVLQLLKTALAAVLAWVVAASLFDLPQPFLAPWAALLVVHATVYRTFSHGLRQIAATVIAVLLAAAVGHALGLDTSAVAVLLVVGLLLGAVPWFGAAEATTIATTGLVVLTTGFSDDSLLVGRLFDTGIGVVIGLVVNFAVWPPLRRRTAIIAMNRIDDGIGGLLADIGAGLGRPVDDAEIEEWIERTRTLDGELDHAWSLVRQARESALMNPRGSAREVRDPQQWYGLLHRMEQAVAETRSMVRTLGGRVAAGVTWDSSFTAPWTELLTDAGRAVADAEPEMIHEVRLRLERLASDLSTPGRITEHWPVYGALVINLRNVLDAMDEVAAANPMSLPPLPRPRPPRATRSGV